MDGVEYNKQLKCMPYVISAILYGQLEMPKIEQIHFFGHIMQILYFLLSQLA